MKVASRRALSALFLLVTLSACGGDEETTPEPLAAEALALTPGDQSLSMGGAAVTFTARGASGTYAWTLSPATGAGSLSASSGASVQYTPPASVSGPVVATLTVSSGTEKAVAVLRVEPRTVQGRVLTLEGDAVPGVIVALAGPAGSFTTVTSDAEGRFGFSNVPATYDLVLVETGPRVVTLFQGLTRADPVLSTYGGTDAPATALRSATVSGTVSGGGALPPPTGTTYATNLSFAAVNASFMSFPRDDADSAGAYDLTVGWTGESATTGTLYALQVQKDAAGNPTAYPGYAKLEGVALTNGDAVTGKNLTLSPGTPTTTFSANLGLPAGTTGTYRYLYLQHAPNAISTLVSNATAGTSFAVATPQLPGAALMALVNFATANGNGQVIRGGMALDASNLAIDLPDVPVRQAPVNGATGVAPGATFSWSALPDAVHFVMVEGSGTDPDFNVVTSNAQFALPDLSALGFPLPRGATYNWSMYTFGGLGSVDAFTTPGGYYRAMYAPVARMTPSESVYLATGSSFSFTTAP